MRYKNVAAFINRRSEMEYLREWIAQEPNHILFLYGPKSSGKTTLIYKFMDGFMKDERRFSVKLINLREVLLVNYEDFLQRFFTVEDPSEKDVSQSRQYDLKVFKLTVQTREKLRDRQLDPFDVMKAELTNLNDRGVRPIIIIDELQALDFIYFNGQRELIKELLNFFVAMTKESHLCHVLLSSSDGYFIEKLYNDSKLRKTSELFEVDYLSEEDIRYWLNHLEKESRIREYTLSKDQIDYVWNHFGGSIWEISSLLGRFLKVCRDGRVPDDEMERIVDRYMLQARSHFEEYVGLKERRRMLLKAIHENMDKGFFKESELGVLLAEGGYTEDGVRDELNYLVRQNYLYYNPTLAEYRLQGRSMEIGLDRYIQETGETESRRR
jgi:AAA+ ATPase superfamily predicted ATPase